jgi:hypothetical protein
MTWALILMACQRVCVPHFVELYPTKAACELKVDSSTSVFHAPRSYCVPIVKETP